ncbi:secreted RxLR effector protein 161-like [Ipomoea triloba]|uniref:secreted RxLR effector protein 161-like n=1 Tax=Ipomoea triloba TaxID=35885 RepID=UPI00125E1331|nr:secreted RxLR effector protein 161-like [Ipomoea triloba]
MDIDNEGKEVDQTKYRGIIGSLLYLTASRPDISFAGVCARFQANLKESHLSAAKKILRYLKGMQSIGLWYPRNGSFDLVEYSDADFAGCKIDRKSTSGTCQFLGGRLVSWFSKKQNSIATSTAEGEYIAVRSLLHSRTKHIDINYHFIRDHVEKKDIKVEYVNTDDQLADILTKPLNE